MEIVMPKLCKLKEKLKGLCKKKDSADSQKNANQGPHTQKISERWERDYTKLESERIPLYSEYEEMGLLSFLR